jgi:hypothetical protein
LPPFLKDNGRHVESLLKRQSPMRETLALSYGPRMRDVETIELTFDCG